MRSQVGQMTVQELFDLSRPQLDDLTRSEQLQSLMCRLIWQRLVADVESVVDHGRRNQLEFRQTDPDRGYLDEWDHLLDDSSRLRAIHGRYDRELSGLYSNTPLVGIVDPLRREQMHRLLLSYRAGAAA